MQLDIHNPLGPNMYEAGASLMLDEKEYFLEFQTMDYAYRQALGPGITAVRHGMSGLIDNLFIITIEAPFLDHDVLDPMLPFLIEVLRHQGSLFPADSDTFMSMEALRAAIPKQ